jgi:hypothetical protein
MEQPGAQQEGEAWRWLYRLWGIRAREAGGGCTQALVHGLDCLRGAGGLRQLRVLDRPAIVRVHDAAGAARWLVLERLRGQEVTLATGGARTTVDLVALDGFDVREFVLLWRPPARRGRCRRRHGARVAWLTQRLDAELGPDATAGVPLEWRRSTTPRWPSACAVITRALRSTALPAPWSCSLDATRGRGRRRRFERRDRSGCPTPGHSEVEKKRRQDGAGPLHGAGAAAGGAPRRPLLAFAAAAMAAAALTIGGWAWLGEGDGRNRLT